MKKQQQTERGITGRMAEADTLDAYLLTPTPRERYRQAAQEAAAYERAGALAMANEWWRAAAGLAISVLDRHWCESRAQWCAHHLRPTTNTSPERSDNGRPPHAVGVGAREGRDR